MSGGTNSPPDLRAARARGRAARFAQMKRTWYFLRRNTLALIGLAIILIMVGVAIFAAFQPLPWYTMTKYCATNQATGEASSCLPSTTIPSICTYPQGSVPPHPGCYETPTGNPSVIAPTFSFSTFSPGPLPIGSMTIVPGEQYFFNPYQGLLRGSDWSLTIAFSIVTGGALIGLLVGCVSGFFGGAVDESLMRLVDIFLSIPQILFVIVVISVITISTPTLFGLSSADTHLFLLITAFLITWWPFYARIVRGQVLVVREQKYVEAARASGAGRGRIILKHVMPNSVYPVFIQMSLDVGTIPLTLGALVFLGFSNIFPSTQFPEWGSIAANAVAGGPDLLQSFLTTCQLPSGCVVPWWQILIPGLVLFAFAISVNFLSDGIRDALDPRLRR